MSKHLKLLREAGLVQVLPDAQRRVYRLRAEGLVEVDTWLVPYRRFWAERLDALEAHLDAMDDGEPAGPPPGATGSTRGMNQGEQV